MKVANRFVLDFLFFVFLLPLSLSFGRFGGKPVDFVLSDVLLPFCFILLLLKNRIRTLDFVRIIILLFSVLYFVIFPVASLIVGNGELVWVISAIRFAKPFLFVWVGFVCQKSLPRFSLADYFAAFSRVSALIALTIVMSDLCLSDRFPYIRWGSHLLWYPVYGFPNSAAVLYVIYFVGLFIPFVQNARSLFGPGVFVWLVFIVMTFSRNAIITCLAFLIIVSVFNFRARRRFILLLFCITLFAAIFYHEILPVISGVVFKFQRTMSSEDPMSGRGAIWVGTLNLIKEKPLVGFSFEPFSNYNKFFDTPHQQYLEILYKSGFLGLLVFILFFGGVIYRIKKNQLSRSYFMANRGAYHSILAAFVALLISNFSQPNFSYSVVGNFLVFFMGVLAFKER